MSPPRKKPPLPEPEAPSLYDAARAGDLKQVKALLKSDPELVSGRNEEIADRTPLHAAAIRGHQEVVKLLLAGKADVHAQDKGGWTPLHWAAREGEKEVVKLLLAAKANVNAPAESGETPLHDAVNQGHEKVVALLLAAKADVNAKEGRGLTPLQRAAAKGRKDIVALLMAHGAACSILDAATMGDVTEVRSRLKDDPRLARSKDSEGVTPLHIAAGEGYKEMAELLLAAGADAKAKSKSAVTPLYEAVDQDHRDIAALLLAHGADATVAQTDHITPLHIARSGAVAELLLTHGADVHARDDIETRTPLHLAALGGRADVIKVLLAHGADAKAANKYGKTPLDFAADDGHKEAVAALMLHQEPAPEKKKAEISSGGRARIFEALLAKAGKLRPQSDVKLDLRKDADDVRRLVADAVGAYAARHKARSSAKTHPPLTRIDLVFSLGDSVAAPWVHLNFDSKAGSEPDGDPTHPDFGELDRTVWLPAVQANAENKTITLVKRDGTTQECCGDELQEEIGKFLVEMLLEARAKGVFTNLPKAPRCELGVEDPGTGAFGWPAYEDRDTALVQ